MDGGRRNSGEYSETNKPSISQQKHGFNLKPLDGERIPLLKDESSARAVDVNNAIREFNAQLNTMHGNVNLDHLPQALQEKITAWVTKITNDFARESHGTSGRFNLLTPKETRELKKHIKLKTIKRDIEVIYDGLMKANTQWPLASTAVDQSLGIEQPSPQEIPETNSSGGRFEPTSLLKGPNVVTKLDFLPQPLREQVQAEIDAISGNFAQHLKDFLDPSNKDQPDQVRANTERKLGELYNDARLRSMSERLNIAIGIKNERTSIINGQVFKDLQEDVKRKFMLKSQIEFETYSQEVFKDYANLGALSKLHELDAHLIKMSVGLRIQGVKESGNPCSSKPRSEHESHFRWNGSRTPWYSKRYQ